MSSTTVRLTVDALAAGAASVLEAGGRGAAAGRLARLSCRRTNAGRSDEPVAELAGMVTRDLRCALFDTSGSQGRAA